MKANRKSFLRHIYRLLAWGHKYDVKIGRAGRFYAIRVSLRQGGLLRHYTHLVSPLEIDYVIAPWAMAQYLADEIADRVQGIDQIS